jgi:ArsR family transcriptional regulator
MDITKYFKALSDETRLRLFNLLLQHELNVNEIVLVMRMGQSRISRHLKILADAGLLSSRRDGSFVYYRSVQGETNQHLVRFITAWASKDEELSADLQRASEIIQEQKSKTRRFFNSIADDWDRLKQDVLGDFDLNRVILERASSCQVAVDLGCGTGDLLVQLLDKAEQVIGVDSSSRMLDKARNRLSGIRQADLRLGELEHLPLPNEEADLAVAHLVLRHIPAPMTAIRETHRILRPSGRFIITDFDRHEEESIRQRYGGSWLGIAARQMQEWLEEAGFSIEEAEQFPVHLGLRVNLFVVCKQ